MAARFSGQAFHCCLRKVLLWQISAGITERFIALVQASFGAAGFLSGNHWNRKIPALGQRNQSWCYKYLAPNKIILFLHLHYNLPPLGRAHGSPGSNTAILGLVSPLTVAVNWSFGAVNSRYTIKYFQPGIAVVIIGCTSIILVVQRTWNICSGKTTCTRIIVVRSDIVFNIKPTLPVVPSKPIAT